MYRLLAKAMMEKTSSGLLFVVRPMPRASRRSRMIHSSSTTESPVYMSESLMRVQSMKSRHCSSELRRTPPPPSTAWAMLRIPVMANQIGAPSQASTHQSCVQAKTSIAGMKPMSTFSTLESRVLR